ncbi:DNA topoisomerase 4 subunit A [Pseudactinotalea sp. HY160]|uniref:DNA gyrase/topoisomerase IV subunit A n=1 Tax=Pseudactinotalea sp. HY160 TaxID=2654490 RepID=UPI00128CBA11|nr:DNA topoisomerase IV subunit A [Pseudactinotalea sp. HY160]MPV49424.1 DNA topoisomerase 4 subunit A [Pseudactinotalea sp. HY160]
MAPRSTSPTPPTGDGPATAERILDTDVSTEMQDSFLEYAYSVIYSRALPDARDGLKPVQRRILYQMAEMGLRPEKGHVKSSRVVGEVMGKLHPHGDTAIYDALVRMAQDFSLRLPLVDGHGNFGSLDDGPAAPRYTEARLAPAAIVMTADLDCDVVDFVPNYDNQLTQPEVLPSALPNLLVNGASGIAVGMATNMAPHNLVEVIAAARHLIAHPDATLEDLIRFVPGPDLPGGGRIVGLEGIRDAYATGRGSFRTRATTRIENVTARRKAIIVTELPYLIGPERVIEKLKSAVQAKKVVGVSGVNDLTDRKHGLRLEIEIKTGFNPEAVLENLYRHTPLEDSFGMNNVALVDGRPRTLGLRDLLQVYVDHRIDVVERRTRYLLARRQERLHLIEGLLVAIADIDEVISVIRSSDDAAAARDRLMLVFDLSEPQADYILALRLRRLTKFSRIELETERDELTAEIARLEAILADDAVLRDVVSSELARVAAEHGTQRRTVLLESAAARPAASAAAPLEIPDAPCWVLLSSTGLLARTSDADRPARAGRRSAHDALGSLVPATARGQIGAVTSAGRLVKVSVLEIPALPPTDGPPGLSGGLAIDELVPLAGGERVVGLAELTGPSEPTGPGGPGGPGELSEPATGPGVLTVATAAGVVKRVVADWPARAEDWEVIGLKDGDEVVGVGVARDDDRLVFVTSDAQLLHFAAGDVRPQGRQAGGMAGIRLRPDVRVLFFGVVPAHDRAEVVTVAGSAGALPGTVTGSAKVTPFELYPGKGRGTAGVRAHRFLRGEDELYAAAVVPAPARAVAAAGQPVELPEPDERRDGSGAPLEVPIAGIG